LKVLKKNKTKMTVDTAMVPTSYYRLEWARHLAVKPMKTCM